MYPAAASIVQLQIASEREVCDFLSLNRSSFQAWQRSGGSERDESDAALLPIVTAVFRKHKRRYGSRRIVEELKTMDIHCGRRRVSKLMEDAGLRAIQPKSFKPRTTESRHRLGYSPNLLLDLLEPTTFGQLWVGDITYIPVDGIGFGYLATLMDRYSRRIVGWDFRDDMTEQLAVTALQRSIRAVQPSAGLIHHTDRGGQYAGKRYRGILSRASMRQSMSRAGDCYDNAFMESCFGTLKTEMGMAEYLSMAIAKRELTEYIQYYNTDRRHSSLGYLTPTQYEAAA
ncbi:IS3 family transposase [Roseimaritima multifibrata]|nr:IS3 family transposase [Roseimaritima multifibrata]